MPGQVLHYSGKTPRDHPPGLFWHHAHPHGESHRQVLDGMSGAIVIEGMERYVPEVGRLRVRVLIVHGLSIEHEPNAAELKRQGEISSKKCGGRSGGGGRSLTVNGIVRPRIEIAPKERPFWP
jgi:suppressor of ftsI